MKTFASLAVVLVASAAAFAGPHEIALRPVEARLQAVAAASQAPYALTGERAQRTPQAAAQNPVQKVTHGGRGTNR